jgi:hypothetical protein
MSEARGETPGVGSDRSGETVVEERVKGQLIDTPFCLRRYGIITQLEKGEMK